MSNKQYLKKHIWHDIFSGVISDWKKYVFLASLIFFMCIQITLKNISMQEYIQLEEKLTFGDYVISILKGMKSVVISPSTIFIPDISWIALYFYLSFIVSYYPTKDLNGYGQLMMLQSKKRFYWWCSKCIWNLCSVLSFYLIIFGSIFIFTLFAGKIDFMPQQDIQFYYNQLDVSLLTPFSLLIIFVLLPFITSCALSLLQMVIAIIISPVIGVAIIATVYVLSIYCSSQWLLGNYLMPVRCSIFLDNKDLNFYTGLILAGVLAISAVICGYLLFRKKDILIRHY